MISKLVFLIFRSLLYSTLKRWIARPRSRQLGAMYATYKQPVCYLLHCDKLQELKENILFPNIQRNNPRKSDRSKEHIHSW